MGIEKGTGGSRIMNRVKFQIECGAVNISPAMALENDNVAKALWNDDTEELRRILREEF